MARLDLAGVQLGMLMGALDEDGGDLDPLWLTDPWGGLVKGLTGPRRWRVGGIAKALLDGGWMDTREALFVEQTSGEAPKKVKPEWYSVAVVKGPPTLNLVWSSGNKTHEGQLDLGLGLVAAKGDLSGLARALAVSVTDAGDGSFTPKLHLEITWAEPVKPISALKAIGDWSKEAGVVWGFDLTTRRDVKQGDDNIVVERTRTLDAAAPGEDAARMLALVFATWAQINAALEPPAALWRQVANHLLPMLGEVGADEAAYPIEPVWLFTPDKAGLGPWVGSLISANGLITFLWHLRALLTGREDPRLFGGSVYAPLDAVPGEPAGAELALLETLPSLGSSARWLKADDKDGVVEIGLCTGADPKQVSPTPLLTLTASGVQIHAGVQDLLKQPLIGEDLVVQADGPPGAARVVLSARLDGAWLHVACASGGLSVGRGGSPDDLPTLSSSLIADLGGSAPYVTGRALRLIGEHADPSVSGIVSRVATLAEGLSDGPSISWLGPEISSVLGQPVKVPLRTTAGPLTLGPLWLTLEEEALDAALDLRLDLAGFRIGARGLGVRITEDGVTPRLDGLSLRLDAPLLELRGAVKRTGPRSFQGSARLNVADTFSIGALAGLGQVEDSDEFDPAIYVFGALRAPLGGPAWCFITGIAGGVGLNYRLPPFTSVDQHPFVRCLWGDSASETVTALEISDGAFWIAGGLTFNSFGVIDGLLLAALQVDPFEIQLLGRAELALEPLASLRLDIGTSVNAERIVVLGGVDGYFLHPDLASVSGEFAVVIWPGDGDFVLTLGGYYPDYPRPDRYPARDRLRMKSMLGPLHVEAAAYLAITPRELMVGARVGVWGDFGVACAGIEAWLDAWIRWDPWFVSFKGGVCIWVDTWATGRFEVNVEVAVWTPEFGGYCEVDLTLTTLEIPFGSDNRHDEPPSFSAVLKSKLALATTSTGWLAFSSDGRVGVFGLEVSRGFAGDPSKGVEDEQPGQSSGAPMMVLPEFQVRIRTRLPLLAETLTPTVTTGASNQFLYEATLDSPLSDDLDLPNTLSIEWWRQRVGGVSVESVSAGLPIPTTSRLPASLFGPDRDARRGAVTIEGFDTFLGLFTPTIPGANSTSATPRQLCAEAENYPLPLGALAPTPDTAASARGGPVGFRAAATAGAAPRAIRLSRDTTVSLARGLRLNPSALPAGAVSSALPGAVTRRPELAAVRLMVVAAPAQQVALGASVPLPSSAPDLGTLSADAAIVRDFGAAVSGLVKMRGDQAVRALVLASGGRVLQDRIISAQGSVRLPRGARKVALIGEGGGAGLPVSGPHVAPAGVEAHTRLLDLGDGLYVGVGCVLRARRRRDARDPEDAPRALTAGALLAQLSRAELRVAAGLSGALILRLVGPLGAGAAAASVTATGATLGALKGLVFGEERILYASLSATAAFQLDLVIADGWTLRGVVVTPSGDPVAELSRALPVDLVDDRMAARKGTSLVTWEVQT